VKMSTLHIGVVIVAVERGLTQSHLVDTELDVGGRCVDCLFLQHSL
jgi:hypothetical protein